MTNSMPAFVCYKNGVELGTVYAVSYVQAMKRARAAFKCRCEVLAVGNVPLAKRDNRTAGEHNVAKVGGRTPYNVGDFEARRAAEIAKWKAANA